MYTFLVLGLIPGTNIQIGFWGWIIIMGISVIVYRRYKAHIRQHVGNWWHQFDDDLENVPHEPLHANRLHLRGL